MKYFNVDYLHAIVHRICHVVDTAMEVTVVAVQENSSDRLNVLYSKGHSHWADSLPTLLEPQGVRSIPVDTVQQAMQVIDSAPIHIAVVDLALPSMSGEKPYPFEGRQKLPGGLKLLRAIHRLTPRPPVIVVRGRLFDRRLDDRLLNEALKLEVFSVLDKPVHLEQMLQVLRRVMERYYAGQWPASPPGA